MNFHFHLSYRLHCCRPGTSGIQLGPTRSFFNFIVFYRVFVNRLFVLIFGTFLSVISFKIPKYIAFQRLKLSTLRFFSFFLSCFHFFLRPEEAEAKYLTVNFVLQFYSCFQSYSCWRAESCLK